MLFNPYYSILLIKEIRESSFMKQRLILNLIINVVRMRNDNIKFYWHLPSKVIRPQHDVATTWTLEDQCAWDYAEILN